MVTADLPEIEKNIFPWQTDQWQGLVARQRSARLPHALLFTGRQGLGKNHFAARFAQALLCNTPRTDGQACHECRACLLYLAGNHPDFISLYPSEEGKPITIDQVRELNDYLSLKSQYGGYRTVLISPAEQMNLAAANGLLKTLEEPGPEALLILVTNTPGILLATIRSRCQVVNFTTPATDAAQYWLETRISSEHDAGRLLALSNGAPLAALALAASEMLPMRNTLLDDLRKLAQGKADPVSVAAEWLQKGAAQALCWMSSWIMDMIRLRSAIKPPYLANTDSEQQLSLLAKDMNRASLYICLDSVSEAQRLLSRQANTLLLLEDVLISWQAHAKMR